MLHFPISMANTENPPPVMLNVVLPKALPAQHPYANFTGVFANTPNEITIVFCQTPLLTDTDMLEFVAGRDPTVTASVVSSVSMPRKIALDMANMIRGLLKKQGLNVDE